MSRLTGQTRENVAELVRRLARAGRDDLTIAHRLALTPSQVRAIRDECDTAAGERRWLPHATTEGDHHGL